MPDDFKPKALEWAEKIQKQVEKKPERRAEFATVSELPIRRVYWPWDVENFDLETDLAASRILPVHSRSPTEHVSRPALDYAAGTRDSEAPRRQTDVSST